MKELHLTDIDQPTILVVVNDIWQPGRAIPSLEDSACGFWEVGNSVRAKACKWLMAVYEGRIVGVWQIDRDKGLLLPSQVLLKTRKFNVTEARPKQRCFSLTPAAKDVEDKFIGCAIANVKRLFGPFGYIGV